MKISSIYLHLFLLSGASAAGPLRRAQLFHGRRGDAIASGPIYSNTSTPAWSPSSNPATSPPSEYPSPTFTPFGTGTPGTKVPTDASSPAPSAPVSPTGKAAETGVKDIPFADIFPSSTVTQTTLQVTGFVDNSSSHSNHTHTNAPGNIMKTQPSQKPTGTDGTIPTAINSFPATTQTVSPDLYQSNLEEARHYNLLFSELEKDTSCSSSQVACVEANIGRCSGGTFNIIQCDQGLACYAFPMNVTSGVQVGCWDLATAEKILGQSGNSPDPDSSTTETDGKATVTFTPTVTVTSDTTKTGGKTTVTVTPIFTLTSDKTVTGGGGIPTTPGDKPQETTTVSVTITPTGGSVTVTVTEDQPSTFKTQTRRPKPSTSTTTVTLPVPTSQTPSSAPPSSTPSTSTSPSPTRTKTPPRIPSTTGSPTSLVVIPVGPPTTSSQPLSATPTPTQGAGTPPPGGVGSSSPTDCPGCWTYDPISPFYITVKETVMVTTTETTTTTDAQTTATILVTG